MEICTYSKVLHFIRDLVQDFILSHAVRVVIAAKSNDHEPVFFAQNRLVDMPAGPQVWKYNGTHSPNSDSEFQSLIWNLMRSDRAMVGAIQQGKRRRKIRLRKECGG